MVEMSPKKYQASVGDFRAAFDVENMFTQASGGVLASSGSVDEDSAAQSPEEHSHHLPSKTALASHRSRIYPLRVHPDSCSSLIAGWDCRRQKPKLSEKIREGFFTPKR